MENSIGLSALGSAEKRSRVAAWVAACSPDYEILDSEDTASIDTTEDLAGGRLITAGSEIEFEVAAPAPGGRKRAAKQTNGKRKRDPADVLEYMERADDKFLEHSRDVNNVLLPKMDEHATAYIALMGRIVSLMEAQLKK